MFITAGPSTKLFACVLYLVVFISQCVLLCVYVCVLLLQDLLQSCARGGTREEPGTLTQGAPVFPGSSRLLLLLNFEQFF